MSKETAAGRVPIWSGLATTQTIKNKLADFSVVNDSEPEPLFKIDMDRRAGTVVVTDLADNQVCYRALQKGQGQPWIVACYNTEQVTWGQNSQNQQEDA